MPLMLTQILVVETKKWGSLCIWGMLQRRETDYILDLYIFDLVTIFQKVLDNKSDMVEDQYQDT